LGETSSIHEQLWPIYEPSALVADEITLVIQVLGKTRGTIEVPTTDDKVKLEQYARESEVAQRHIGDQPIRKVIVVPDRKLVNFVIG
jgi:leucyl-tRNA synthetase